MGTTRVEHASDAAGGVAARPSEEGGGAVLVTEHNYRWLNTAPRPSYGRLAVPLGAFLSRLPRGSRVLDVGCGNGFNASKVLEAGHRVVGIDPSAQGIELCRRTYPAARFERMGGTARVLEELGEEPFDAVISTEVCEHVFDAWEWARCCFGALRPGAPLFASTPYHGYLKDLALAVTGRWGKHHQPLITGGHIKFFDKRNLTRLLMETGFRNLRYRGLGRVPYLWMNMVVEAERPGA